jgi:hypothetical protein
MIKSIEVFPDTTTIDLKLAPDSSDAVVSVCMSVSDKGSGTIRTISNANMGTLVTFVNCSSSGSIRFDSSDNMRLADIVTCLEYGQSLTTVNIGDFNVETSRSNVPALDTWHSAKIVEASKRALIGQTLTKIVPTTGFAPSMLIE